MTSRREEISKLADYLEREKEMIEARLRELYAEDEALWEKEQEATDGR